MKVQVVQTVEAPVERAWPIFSDFTALAGMMPDARVDIEGSGVGAIRTVTNPDGSKIQERLESLDDANRVFSYAVINDDAPVPFTGYLATVKLRGTGDNQSEVDWSSEFEARGLPEADVRKIIEGAYKAVIRHLSSKVASA